MTYIIYYFQAVAAWTHHWQPPPHWRIQARQPLGRARRPVRRHRPLHPIPSARAVVLVQVHITAQAVHPVMQVFKDRVHFPAALAAQPGHHHIKVRRPVQQHHSTPPLPHRVARRHPVLDHRLIPPVFRRLRIIPDRRTMVLGPVRSVHLQVRRRSSSVDPVPRDHHSYHQVLVIRISLRTVNRLVVHSMVYHQEAHSDLEDILWRDPWVLDIRR